MDSLHDKSGDRKYLNPTERAAFYDAVRKLNHPEKRSFCLTLFYTGCRISEALELHGRNIDEGERCLVFRTLKQRKKKRYRAVPVPDEHLQSLFSIRRRNTWRIWKFGRTTGYNAVKGCMKMAGLDGTKATPKGLRHGFAITCLTQGIPLPTVQKWLGHARLDTTSIYLDFVGDDERKLAEKIWNLGH